MFIAKYDEYCGTGETLEEAFEDLINYNDCGNDLPNATFFEATAIEVEFKIVKKEVPTKVKKEK